MNISWRAGMLRAMKTSKMRSARVAEALAGLRVVAARQAPHFIHLLGQLGIDTRVQTLDQDLAHQDHGADGRDGQADDESPHQRQADPAQQPKHAPLQPVSRRTSSGVSPGSLM